MNSFQLKRACSLLSCAALIFLLALPAIGVQKKLARAKMTPKKAPSGTLKQVFTQGKFYFNNGDTSDNAVNHFNQIIEKYPNAPEAEESQFFLGRYYHRKYYILKEKRREVRPDILSEAEQAFKKYVNKYAEVGSGKWLSDALFNLALIHFQLEKYTDAYADLNGLSHSSGRDEKVSIYQVVWSSNYDSVIDAYFDAARLADFTKELAGRSRSFEQFVSDLTEACKSHKY